MVYRCVVSTVWDGFPVPPQHYHIIWLYRWLSKRYELYQTEVSTSNHPFVWCFTSNNLSRGSTFHGNPQPIRPCLHQMPPGKSCEDPAVDRSARTLRTGGVLVSRDFKWYTLWVPIISLDMDMESTFQYHIVSIWFQYGHVLIPIISCWFLETILGHGPSWVPCPKFWGLRPADLGRWACER